MYTDAVASVDRSSRGLGTALAAIGSTEYDRRGPRDQPIFHKLKDLSAAIQAEIPAHYLTKISRGVGGLPTGLWAAILDPQVTDTPTEGVYVVYLFDAVRTTAHLSLNQGVTAIRKLVQGERGGARRKLHQEAAGIRALLAGGDLTGLVADLDLGTTQLLGDYAAGNVLAVTYDLFNLPPDDQLRSDLQRFLDLYAQAVSAIDIGLTTGNALASVPARKIDISRPVLDIRFEPKDASEYRASVGAQEQVKSRSHEKLVRTLGEWAQSRGYQPNTFVHPRDLILHGAEYNLLVEVKVFPAGRPRKSIRSAIGQLFEYNMFYPDPPAKLVAALSQYPGDAYCSLLSSLDIATVWPQGLTWQGTSLARDYGLA